MIAGNWKMYKTTAEAKSLVHAILLGVADFREVDVVICPPYTSLVACNEELGNSTKLHLGAQNVHQEKEGAYTGEISITMLRDMFCRYVILGHSERRQYFHETDELVNKKIKISLEANIKPIVCLGETLEQREGNKTKSVIQKQFDGAFEGITEAEWSQIVIAYEPVWAIGTGKTATPEQAQEVHAMIRSFVAKHSGETVAERVRILYGGSVKPANSAELLSQPDIDGALVGGASLEARSFLAIVESAVVQEEPLK
jgi:triosephosphate isomerase